VEDQDAAPAKAKEPERVATISKRPSQPGFGGIAKSVIDAANATVASGRAPLKSLEELLQVNTLYCRKAASLLTSDFLVKMNKTPNLLTSFASQPCRLQSRPLNKSDFSRLSLILFGPSLPSRAWEKSMFCVQPGQTSLSITSCQ
jgi:hypothetical protein